VGGCVRRIEDREVRPRRFMVTVGGRGSNSGWSEVEAFHN
jgi:hypothetical protein